MLLNIMQLKKYTDGTHRILTPEQTLEKITPFLKSMGITRVANLTGLDEIGIPVISACRPNSKSLAISQGKGHSIEAAKVSALMESIELYHAENIKLNTITACYKDLNNAIDYYILPRCATKNFTENTEIKWVECQSIKDNSIAWLPHELIYADFTVPVEEDYGYFIADSNGLASGNSLTEAINHGLYEVIERDCLALWQLTPDYIQNNKRVDIKSINNSYLESILLKLKSIQVGIWDITSDIGIPTFLCKIISNKNINIRPAYGSGTHLDKNIALSRAITEAAQSRVTFISGARDDQYHDIYENTVSDDFYNLWLEEICNIDSDNLTNFESIPSFTHDNLEDDLNHILSCLNDVGLQQAYYANLTKDEYNIAVVKIIIPGTEGIDDEGKRLLGARGIKFYDQYGIGACEVK